MSTWQWDPTLYAGSAGFYSRGRVPYASALFDLLVTELQLDGSRRLLDLGCGPGSLTLPLASHALEAVGVDPDAGMLTEAARRARQEGVQNVRWINAKAEDMCASWGTFEVVTIAQSFHWMNRVEVARLLRVGVPHGVVAFVHATTHRGFGVSPAAAHPAPPWDQIEALIDAHLGVRRRAGAGHRDVVIGAEGPPAVDTSIGTVESAIFTQAGFLGPTRRRVPAYDVTRTADEIVASVFSLSYAAPHLFGERLVEAEASLRDLLREASPSGLFSERMREIVVDVWR